MLSENYYLGPKSDVQKLLDSHPLFRATRGGKLIHLKEYSWQEFMTQVATNYERIKGFSAAELELEAVLSKKPKGKCR